MNELDLMTRFRDEVPLEAGAGARAEQAVLTVIRQEAAHEAGRPRRDPALRRLLRGLRPARGTRLRPALAGALAVAVGATAYAGVALSGGGHSPVVQAGAKSIPWSGQPTAPWPATAAWPAVHSYGRAKTGAQLVDYATRAAATTRAPKPNEWVVVKQEFADSSKGTGEYPLDERKVSLDWVRGDGCSRAQGPTVPASLDPAKTVSSKLRISTYGPGPLGSKSKMCGADLHYADWKSITYPYLNSLPTDPAALEKIILEKNPPGGPLPTRERAIFDAIYLLLTDFVQDGSTVVPPKLEAAFYRILQQLPGVRFETAIDLAGRTGVGFTMVEYGYSKEEIVINPLTYAYMGSKDVAVKDNDASHWKKGQVMGWSALLGSAIVQKPGQLP